MLHRCCTLTILLLVVGCFQCLNVIDRYSPHSFFEFRYDDDGGTYITRVNVKFYIFLDEIRVDGFTSHTINAEGTVISRVDAWYSEHIVLASRRRSLDETALLAELPWITKSPFVEDFWLGPQQLLPYLSVHVYNMSVNQTIVSSLQAYWLTELEITGNNWTVISRLTLNLSSLKKLSLSNNQIEVLYQGALKNCHVLEVLDLSRNKFTVYLHVLDYLAPVRNTLKELILANNIINIFETLYNWRFYPLLKKVDMSYNQISSVDLRSVPENCEVDLSFNNITKFRNSRYSFRADRMVLAGQNISSLSEVGTILSNIDSESFEYSISIVELVYDNSFLVHAVYIPQSDCTLDKNYIHCKGNGSQILPRRDSSFVNLKGNPIKIDGSVVFEICAENHVDLSRNDLKVLNEDVPAQISDTKQLNLSRNSIGYVSTHLFENMTRLTVLDLSYNHIKHLQLILYSSLFMVDISNNYLYRAYISHNSSEYTTEYLNLSHNSFSDILEVEWSQFKQFSKVDLGQNNLQCCGPKGQNSRIMLLHYQDKILNINSTKALSCVMPYNRRVEMTNTWLSEDHCQNHLQGWVAFGCLLFLTPLLIHAVELLDYYIHQTERDLAHHLTRLKKQGLEQDERHALECEYDVFVCHSHKDLRWVHQELVPNLENEKDGHRLCVHYRDFPLGSLIEENIETAMNTSRKVIVVVTRAFLQSYWCKMELTFAWTKMVSEGRNYIIVIELERIPKDKRPPILCYLMASRTYLEWPEEPTGVVKQNCWRRVRDALGKSLRDRRQKQQNGPEAFQIDCQ